MPTAYKSYNKRFWEKLSDGTHCLPERRVFNLQSAPELPAGVEIAHNAAYQRQPDGSLRRVNIIKASTGELVALPMEKKHGKHLRKNR